MVVQLDRDRICRYSVQRKDTQMLFDPFEEDFYLPAVAVQQCGSRRTAVKVVGDKVENQFLFLTVVVSRP